jgi:hypothetical protein
MTRAMRKREADGYPVSDEWAAAFGPSSNEHIHRFGNYHPNFSRMPDPVALEFWKPPQGETGRILVMMPQAGSKSAQRNR